MVVVQLARRRKAGQRQAVSHWLRPGPADVSYRWRPLRLEGGEPEEEAALAGAASALEPRRREDPAPSLGVEAAGAAVEAALRRPRAEVLPSAGAGFWAGPDWAVDVPRRRELAVLTSAATTGAATFLADRPRGPGVAGAAGGVAGTAGDADRPFLVAMAREGGAEAGGAIGSFATFLAPRLGATASVAAVDLAGGACSREARFLAVGVLPTAGAGSATAASLADLGALPVDMVAPALVGPTLVAPALEAPALVVPALADGAGAGGAGGAVAVVEPARVHPVDPDRVEADLVGAGVAAVALARAEAGVAVVALAVAEADLADDDLADDDPVDVPLVEEDLVEEDLVDVGSTVAALAGTDLARAALAGGSSTAGVARATETALAGVAATLEAAGLAGLAARAGAGAVGEAATSSVTAVLAERRRDGALPVPAGTSGTTGATGSSGSASIAAGRSAGGRRRDLPLVRGAASSGGATSPASALSPWCISASIVSGVGIPAGWAYPGSASSIPRRMASNAWTTNGRFSPLRNTSRAERGGTSPMPERGR